MMRAENTRDVIACHYSMGEVDEPSFDPNTTNIHNCTLGNFELVAQNQQGAVVVLFWPSFSAEVSLVIDYCHSQSLPLLIVTSLSKISSFSQLASLKGAVIQPSIVNEDMDPWLEYAYASRQEFDAIEKKLHQLEQEAKNKVWIDRAKGLLMDKHGLTEQKAHQMIQSTAMNANQSMYQIAKRVVEELSKAR
ncbi:ANTAR domain-containing protein [Vibrio maerlii]|uniref:ANTAR domain-containing protein n=1 Tax=Vibrio maerlii TaxID=2231648 RepID=UPI000E3BBACC|nr:ANTAR domain-containing protein [Vibrio maerlii]